MINNIVNSINAGFTKAAGELAVLKVKKTNKKITNLDDLRKVQAIPQVVEVKGKIINNHNKNPPYKRYNPKEQMAGYNNSERNLDVTA